MATRELPSPELLRKLLAYDPETGVLTWRERTASFYEDGAQSAEHRAAVWNATMAGKPALASPDKDGYHRGTINQWKYSTHRVVWAIVYGEWPNGEIDHINHQRADNRISNLRVVTTAENRRNLAPSPKNRTGVAGVKRSAKGDKWVAQIRHQDGHLYLGSHDRFEDAVTARRAAERRLGYHANHCQPATAIEAGAYRKDDA